MISCMWPTDSFWKYFLVHNSLREISTIMQAIKLRFRGIVKKKSVQFTDQNTFLEIVCIDKYSRFTHPQLFRIMSQEVWKSFCWKFKGNAQFVQKVTFKIFDVFQTKPLWKLELLQKLLLLKSFLHLRYQSTQLLFLWQCFLIFSWDKR